MNQWRRFDVFQGNQIFRSNMAALVADAAKRRRAKVFNAAADKPRVPEPKQAA